MTDDRNIFAFLAGIESVWAILFVWVCIEQARDPSAIHPFSEPDPARMLALLLMLPLITAWLSTEAICALRHPRLFDRRAAVSPVRRAVLGLIFSVASVAMFILFTACQPETQFPDAVNVIFSAAAPTLALGLLLRRNQPNHCVVCEYDTRHLPFAAEPRPRRCPECGAEIAAGGVEMNEALG